jgi:hypothetical protein
VRVSGSVLTVRFLFAYHDLGYPEPTVGRHEFTPRSKQRGDTAVSETPGAARVLTLYYGFSEMARLSHYFLPRVLLAEKRILYLDGANQISRC